MLTRPNLFTSAVLLCFLITSVSQSEESVLNTTIFKFPNALPGKEVEVRKLYNPNTRSIRISSNSEYIKSAQDLVNLETQEALLIRRKFGALAGQMRDKYASMNTSEAVEIIVHLKEPENITYLNKTKHSEKELKAQSLTLAALSPVIDINSFAARHGLEMKGRRSSKSFRCIVNKHKLAEIMFDSDVAAIDEYREDVPVQGGNPDLSTLSASAYNHGTSAPPSTAGAGINAATFESGIDPTVMSCFGGLNGNRIDQRTQTWTDWEHSQITFRCLTNTARGANLYHRWSSSFDGLGDSTYIIDSAMRSMSMSYARGGQSPYSETYGEFRVMDDFTYRYPYPVFNNPTANAGYQHVANWQCFNAISVGNVRHTNQSTWEMVDTTNASGGCTQTTNPPAKYGSTRDREMPMIVAPGITPTSGVAMTESCLSGSLTHCGTSLSAPITNGISTAVIAADGRMVSWPEKVRAVLLATAKNVSGSYWTPSQDLKDGAGVVYGSEAVIFAQTHASAQINGTANVHGIYAGSLNSSDFSTGDILFNIQIPNPKPSGRHLRVVLTWDSNPVLNTATNELSDLDLHVDHNSGFSFSSSWNSNVEIVDVPASMLTAGSTYAAKILKYADRIPSGSRANYFYYAIAWTWAAD